MAKTLTRLNWTLALRDASELSPTAKLFGLVLTTYMDDNGACWPSVGAIAKAMSVSTPTVKRARRELEAAGLLDVTERSGHSSLYQAVVPAATRVTHDPPGGSPMTPHPGHQRPPEPSIELVREPVTEPRPTLSELRARLLADGYEDEGLDAVAAEAVGVPLYWSDLEERDVDRVLAYLVEFAEAA